MYMFLMIFAELPADTKEKWETFVSGTLADVNKQNTVELVTVHFYIFHN